MNRKLLKIGIMPKTKFQAYTIAIAKGEYKPQPSEPKIWFASMKTLAQVLSDENQALLEIIDKTQPNSIQELAATTGKKSNHISQSLKTMERYGIVELVKTSKTVRPIVKATDFQIECGLYSGLTN